MRMLNAHYNKKTKAYQHTYLFQHSRVWVHRSIPQLRWHHFSQSFKSLHLRTFLIVGGEIGV